MPDQRILMGVIGRAHGVRGLVRVHSYTADPADLPDYGPFTDERGRVFTLRWSGEGVAELTELRDGVAARVADRTAVERLVNTKLFVDRDRLPAAEEDEFYLADLVGLAAVSPEGQSLGPVAAVHDYGAGVSLEIGRHFVPFNRACVPVVDIAGGRIVVALPDEIEVPPEAMAEQSA